MLRQFFDPDDLWAAVLNWEEVARDLIRHLDGEVAIAPSDAIARALLDEVLRYSDVPPADQATATLCHALADERCCSPAS
jgi:transcription regulator MmyB-like protein